MVALVTCSKPFNLNNKKEKENVNVDIKITRGFGFKDPASINDFSCSLILFFSFLFKEAAALLRLGQSRFTDKKCIGANQENIVSGFYFCQFHYGFMR